MSCNYCWNQPKKYERYDLYLDGKIKADDFVYRTKDESGEIISIKLSEKFEELENRLETHFTFDNTYQTYDELEVAFANRMLKESVIYIVRNEDTSDDPDRRDVYNEYMIMGGKLELIGSGSYAKQQADLDKEIAARIKDVDDEEKRATDEEERIEEKLDQEIDDREEADKNISDTVASITGYSFEKISAENSATNIDNRIKTEINRATVAEETLDKKIDDTKTDLQKEIDDDVKVETDRATEKENDIISKLTTITGYDYSDDDVTTKGGNIDTRINNEIKDREEADKLIRDTVASITGYSFEKVGKIASNFGHEDEGKNNWGDAKGFDTVITDSGKLDEIDVYCRYTPGVDNKTICLKLWKITYEQEGKFLINYLGTSDNYQTHDTVGKELKYTFHNSDINVTNGDKIRVTFHDESQNDVTSYDQSTCTGTCIQINSNQPSSDFVILNNNGGQQNYVAKHNVHVVTEGKSLLDTTQESISISTQNTRQIESLTDTITELRKNIVVLELDKGYKITSPTIEASYEEGSLSDVILGDLTVTSENLQIGSNEVNVKITDITIGDKSYSLNVDSTCEIILDELGDVQNGTPLVLPVEITDTVTTTTTNPETGLEEEVEETVTVATGTINVAITGTHKKQTVTLHYNLIA